MYSQAGLQRLFPGAEVAAVVHRLASQIAGDYCGSNPVLIGVLKGSFIFLADLVRQLDFPLEVDFIRLASYGGAMQTSGHVRVLQSIRSDIKGREVLVVEDIVDTGLTMSFLMDYLGKKQPASVRLCTLADKPSRRQVPVNIDYTGLTVPDRFLVGYGLGLDEQYRHLPDICFLEG
jgi:hypoxanthine phosphoribosyltransferase